MRRPRGYKLRILETFLNYSSWCRIFHRFSCIYKCLLGKFIALTNSPLIGGRRLFSWEWIFIFYKMWQISKIRFWGLLLEFCFKRGSIISLWDFIYNLASSLRWITTWCWSRFICSCYRIYWLIRWKGERAIIKFLSLFTLRPISTSIPSRIVELVLHVVLYKWRRISLFCLFFLLLQQSLGLSHLLFNFS